MKISTTSERIKLLMNERGLRQVDILESCKPFCEKERIKIQKSDLSQYISGKVEPKQDKLSILAAALNVNEAWLAGYDVPIDEKNVKDSTIPSNAFPLGHYRIPVVATVAAGEPIFSEESILEWIDYDKDPRGEVFGLRIKGDSMIPRISDGDTIVVDKSAVWEDGDIVVVTVNGNDGTCKRIRKYKDGISLISLNPSYEPIFFTKSQVEELPVRVVGRVMESRSKF